MTRKRSRNRHSPASPAGLSISHEAPGDSSGIGRKRPRQQQQQFHGNKKQQVASSSETASAHVVDTTRDSPASNAATTPGSSAFSGSSEDHTDSCGPPSHDEEHLEQQEGKQCIAKSIKQRGVVLSLVSTNISSTRFAGNTLGKEVAEILRAINAPPAGHEAVIAAICKDVNRLKSMSEVMNFLCLTEGNASEGSEKCARDSYEQFFEDVVEAGHDSATWKAVDRAKGAFFSRELNSSLFATAQSPVQLTVGKLCWMI